MSSQLELALLALAAIFDGVLLLIVLERVNASQVSVWLKSLIVAVLAAHGASLTLALMDSTHSDWGWRLDRACKFIVASALLVMPSAMLHGAIRLNHTGSTGRPPIDWRYLVLYAPLLSVFEAARLAFAGAESDFLRLFASLKWPYIGWLATANVCATLLFLRAGRLGDAPSAKAFFKWLAIVLLAMTGLAIGYASLAVESALRDAMRLITILSPLLPSFLFVWFALRKQLLSLVVERTFFYGAIILGLLMLHQILVAPQLDRVQDRWRLNLAPLELAAIVGLVLVWKPLRLRVGEALRYLLSSNVFQIRDATRQLSVELSRMAKLPAEELIGAFANAVKKAINVQCVRIELLDEEHQLESAANVQNDVRAIWNVLRSEDSSAMTRDRFLARTENAALERLGGFWAFRIHYDSVRGVAILGPRLRCDRLAEEQLAALSLLFEQFAATLHNRQLDAQRLRAQRAAMQQEKLSVLGLMAGSLVHELRNPLSSIRAIASLMLEDVRQDQNAGASSSHRQDLEMILAEIDRLTQATQRLLDYARPPDAARGVVVADRVIQRILYVLGPFARQQNVRLETQLLAPRAEIVGTDATLSEILFNLIRNAIEAVRQSADGCVTIDSSVVEQTLIVAVTDNGLGVAPAVRDALFQPFVTDKADGTGLGLYIVGERVRELAGEVQCVSRGGLGTRFELRFQIAPSGAGK